MNRIAGRAGITLLLVVLLLAGFVLFIAQFVMQSDDWVIFSGSPHVYNGGNIGCGAVVDAEGALLLDMNNGREYSNSLDLRKSTIHWVGDRYGSISAPALPSYAAQLAGYDLLGGVYSYGQTSGVAKLTLAGSVQTAALEAMGGYSGTVAVYNYKTGQLLCAVTTPTYDPDDVPDVESDDSGKFEGLYVNRFTQSRYIPGSIFKVVTLAVALETQPQIAEQTFVCTGSYEIGGDEITCEGAHWEQDLTAAFRNSCNCAFAQIAQQLGGDTLERYVERFGVTEELTFDGITTAEGNFDVENASEVSVAWSSIGQYNDQVNPCAYLTFMGAIANGGKGALPYLVEEISVGSGNTYTAKTKMGERIMSVATADALVTYLRNNVENKYGSENFGGLTVCAKTGTAEVGGEKKPNAMLVGFATDPEYPLAFIVCAEDAGYGSTVCIPIAGQVLSACKAYLDG